MKTYRSLKEISFSMLVSPCGCRCPHCKSEESSPFERWGGSRNAAPLPFSVCRDAMETVRHWRDRNGYTGIRLNFGETDCSDFPEIGERIRYARSLYGQAGTLVMGNGMRLFSEDELRRWLETVRAAGAETIGTSFYGTRKAHDAFAGRDGDYDQLLLMNRLAAELGLRRLHVLFFARSRIPYLEELRDTLCGIGGQVAFQFRPFFGPVQDAYCQSERITRAEYEALPAFARKSQLLKLRTVEEWQAHFQTAYRDPLDEPPRPVIDLNINMLTPAAFRGDAISALIDRKIDEYLAQFGRTASMRRLAGDYSAQTPGEGRLYTYLDLETSWHTMFLRDHPGHGSMHRFNYESVSMRR